MLLVLQDFNGLLGGTNEGGGGGGSREDRAQLARRGAPTYRGEKGVKLATRVYKLSTTGWTGPGWRVFARAAAEVTASVMFEPWDLWGLPKTGCRRREAESLPPEAGVS